MTQVDSALIFTPATRYRIPPRALKGSDSTAYRCNDRCEGALFIYVIFLVIIYRNKLPKLEACLLRLCNVLENKLF